MGKHSDPKPSWSAHARSLLRDVAAGGRNRAGRHGQEPSTATGVLKSVRRRPMVAAIALPAAATTAIVASSFAFAPADTAGVVKAEDQAATASAEPGAQDVPTRDAEELEKEREAAAEEYRKSLEDDPKYNQKAEVKAALSAPESSKEGSAETSGGESSDRGSKSSRSDSRESSGLSDEPCSVSSGIEPQLTANAKKGYRAVCAEFPEVKTFGGPRNDPGSDHHTGQALDIMISGSTGDRITDFGIKHASELGVKYVIYEQKLYAPYTGWEGRAMEDRGSATANHMDHVHISFN